MILVIDVGNTNIVLGVMEGLELRAQLRISTGERTTDEVGILMLQGLAHRKIALEQIEGAIVSSVHLATTTSDVLPKSSRARTQMVF